MKRRFLIYKNRIYSILVVAVTSILFSSIGFVSRGTEKLSWPKYSGEGSVIVNNNVPTFTSDEIVSNSYEKYGDLDKLGRCTTAIACIGQDLMPTEPRGSINMIKPSGWNQNKYEGIVDSTPPYLFNRCHLIGFQLTGENANENNLITGTRYMNVEGMLPYENMVATYIDNSGNHVMYRATPVFEGDNLLCNGVNIEALSVEDNGKGISFNVYCFNVQPGIVIDYSDGSNKKDENYTEGAVSFKEIENSKSTTTEISRGVNTAEENYVANTNTKKFHYPWCKSVDDMKEKNRLNFYGNRDELIEKGYDPCKRCNP